MSTAIAVSLCGTTYSDIILDSAEMPEDTVVNDFTSFDNELFETNGPVMLMDGVVWTAESDGWIGDMAFGLRDNGVWNKESESFAALNGSASSMIFAFPQLMSAVGGFVNYAPLDGFGSIPTIYALDINGHTLESFEMDIQTPGGVNEGQFMGFVRDDADIAFLKFEARFGVLDNFSYYGPQLPAPTSLILFIIAGSAFGIGRQRITN